MNWMILGFVIMAITVIHRDEQYKKLLKRKARYDEMMLGAGMWAFEESVGIAKGEGYGK